MILLEVDSVDLNIINNFSFWVPPSSHAHNKLYGYCIHPLEKNAFKPQICRV